MHDGGGLFAQGLSAHTMVGPVATAERYGHRGSRVLCSILYLPSRGSSKGST